MNNQEYDDRTYYISSLIKLVAEEDVECISKVARNIQRLFERDEIHELNNQVVYNAYCNCGGRIE